MIRHHKGKFAALLFVLLACRSVPPATVPATALPSEPSHVSSTEAVSLATITPRPSPTPVVPDSGWQVLRPGLEKRVMNLIAADGEWQENMVLLRVEPAQFRFDVRYQPGEPKGLMTWQSETDALIVVNGGFFTKEYQATGLIISEGEASGVSYSGFGGMFAITEHGPELRSLLEQPFVSHEGIRAALQSFPMLLTSGGSPGISQDDGERARRTVVGQDGEGRILFMVASFGHFTLYQLSQYLASSDLNLNVALNLDGGTSSGLIMTEPSLHIPAFALLPSVITVHER